MAEQFNESNFQSEVIESDKPVLVDFWAEWCGPCKMIGPLIDQLSGELDGQAKVGKVNVDEARNLAVKYGVRSIPLLLFFKDGEVKDQIVGANVTKEMLKQKLMTRESPRARPFSIAAEAAATLPAAISPMEPRKLPTIWAICLAFWMKNTTVS